MNLLALVTAFCSRQGVPTPTFVVGNTNQQIAQILGLVQETLEDMVDRPNQVWTVLNKEATFQTVAAELQGSLESLAPNGYLYILNDTIYDREQRLPPYGPITPQEWQQLKALPTAGPFYRYRIWQGGLYLYPTPPVDHTYAFEYASNFAVVAEDGTTFKRYFSADTDTCLLPDHILLRGLRWRWKKEKGQDYAQEFAEYEHLITNAIGRDGTKPVVYMGEGSKRPIQPGIFVPAGNWDV